MVNSTRKKFLAAFTVALLSLSSPLIWAGNSWAQKPTDAQIAILIEKLANAKTLSEEIATYEKLSKIGQPSIPALIKFLKDKNHNWVSRLFAALILESIGQPAVPALIAALKDPDQEVRYYAAYALGNVGVEAKAAVPALIVTLKDKDKFVRGAAAKALGEIGVEAKAAVSVLRAALQDPDKDVRSSAAEALGKIGAEAKAAVPALSTALKDKDQDVRYYAAYALKEISNEIGTEAKAAVPDLIVALKDKDQDVRKNAAGTLGRIGAEAKVAVPALSTTLKDKDQDVRYYAAYALNEISNEIGAEAKAAVPDLIVALKDKDQDVRKNAAGTLGRIGAEAKVAVPDLITALKDKDQDVRGYAADALGRIGEEAKAAVPDLIVALKDSDKDVRGDSALALGKMGEEAKAAVPALIAALKDEDKWVRNSAAYALGKLSLEAKVVLPYLISALKDPDKNVRNWAAFALNKYAVNLPNKAKANALSTSDLDRAISDFEAALKILQGHQANFSKEDIILVSFSLDALKAKKTEYLFINGILKNPWVWGTGIYLVSLLGIFWIRPLWLLKIDEFLKPLSFKLPPLGPEISLRFLLFPKYHPRVLDAWVTKHLKSVREEFQQKDTVKDRNIYIPIPVILNGRTVAQLTSQDLRSTFKKHLLIWGEGGVGKTSLACQIAQWAMSDDKTARLCEHRMLPVLIEEDLNLEATAGKQPFIAAIQGQLQDLTDESEPISEELLERLLRRRRILVILDHLSELSAATRKAIRPESPDFPVNALVVTSRIEETLGHVTKTSLKPLRIEGNRLSSFMEAYLMQRGKRDLFTDAEFFDACSHLSLMVGQRNITALLAKLYAEQLIAAKIEESQKLPLHLPDNIPDLMLSYLNELNRDVTGDKFDNRAIHHHAKIIAWECLKQLYRPSSVKREDAIKALDGDNAEACLKYLETRLRVIQTIGPGQDQMRFSLDPLAEYLAALHLLSIYGQDEQLWQQFLQAAPTMPDAPESIKGFLLAVRDCCLAKGKAAKVPDFVAEELGKLAGVASAAQPAVGAMQTGIVS
jgi:HEAT repeat protein